MSISANNEHSCANALVLVGVACSPSCDRFCACLLVQEVVFNPSYDRVCVSLLVQDEDDLQSDL